MNATDKHNRLAREFVMRVAAETNSYSEMLVVVESMILASLLLLHRRNGFKPATSTEMIESAVLAATERFTASVNGGSDA